MGDVFLAPWVLPVEMAVIGEKLGGRNLPGPFIFLLMLPSIQTSYRTGYAPIETISEISSFMPGL